MLTLKPISNFQNISSISSPNTKFSKILYPYPKQGGEMYIVLDMTCHQQWSKFSTFSTYFQNHIHISLPDTNTDLNNKFRDSSYWFQLLCIFTQYQILVLLSTVRIIKVHISNITSISQFKIPAWPQYHIWGFLPFPFTQFRV